MAGAAGAGELSAAGASRGGVRFALATPADDAELRRLLRENPMAGRISISLEREPSYFAAAAIEGEHQTIVAYEGDRLVCAGNVSVRQRFINGAPMRVGYLGGLRLDSTCRGRTTIVRRGYEMFRKLHDAGGPPIYLTSIAHDNEPARRLLEAGLRGMPTYRFLGRFVTFVMSRNTSIVRDTRHFPRLEQRGLGVVEGDSARIPMIAELLRRRQVEFQFSPVWSESEIGPGLSMPGLGADRFRLVCGKDGAAHACAAIWDQRAIKQTVIRGYSPMMRRLRLVINAVSRLVGAARLPRVGEAISSAFISHVAGGDESAQFCSLLASMHERASSLDVDYFVTGFDERDPRVAIVRREARAREYVSRLYAVHWEDGAELAASLDDRLLAPEVALL